MPTKNIFAGFGLRTEFVNRIYNELMKRSFLTYADVLAAYYGRPQGYYDKMACNSEPGYGELQGRILLYGENLEVISPLSLREQIKEILRRQMQHYSENK